MNTWILVLVSALADGTFETEEVASFDYKPSCQIAAEGRQLYKTGERIDYQQYLCIAPFPKEDEYED
ncbi:MAG: hypothetical protein CMA64_06555 [Euryarchaeota archaeon]|nr:hypothetical protein [Euryarchaeota archaeon]